MARVSVSIPDEIVVAAKAAGLNISRLSTKALTEQLDRRAKVAELDAYLAELEHELGPVSDDDAREAADWAAGLDEASRLDAGKGRRSA